MAGKSYKFVERFSNIEDAAADFYNEVQELAGECREIVDNASEGLAQTDRIQTFESTADTLENISEENIPKVARPEHKPDFSHGKRLFCSARCGRFHSRMDRV